MYRLLNEGVGCLDLSVNIFKTERIVAGSPVVVFFYGGSWKRGEKGKYRFVGHSLGSKGYITVIPENSRELKHRVYECAGDVRYFELDDTGHFSIVLGLSDSFLAKNTIQLSIEKFLQSLSQQSG